MGLSIVIPFYNEENNIRRVVDGLVDSFEQASIDYELVLVNNGSIDKSPQILEELSKQSPHRIKVVHVGVNQGYGWGIISGLKQVSGEFVGYMAGDGQIAPSAVVNVFDRISKEGYDLVKVRRVVRNDGTIRKILSVSYNLLVKVIFNVDTMDVNGTPKIFKRELLEVFSPVSKDWFIDTEIMVKAKYLGLKVGEVPVEFLPRKEGKSHVRSTTIWEFARNVLNYEFGRGVREWKRKTSKS
ncbi:MAG: glycosyl transferase, family 2 [Dehalococcoidales bacterium]|nr:glycosyl transferase, family 2 [Dehalococcoidales bacterium]